jgi:meso-butanediol dehydrogenase/(S,S)-butanediol dehydrogenase/diacetyl reductase
MNINGKDALITGPGQGIGRAIALQLASDGAHIAIVDMKEDQTLWAPTCGSRSTAAWPS